MIEGRNTPGFTGQGAEYDEDDDEGQQDKTNWAKPMTRDQWIRDVLAVDVEKLEEEEQQQQKTVTSQQQQKQQQQQQGVIQYPILVHHAPYVYWPQHYTHQQQQMLFYQQQQQQQLQYQYQPYLYGKK